MIEHYLGLARELIGGRKVIVPGGVLANGAARAAALRGFGASDVFLLAGSRGTGAIPTPDEAASHDLDVGGTTTMENFRRTEAALADLPAEALAALDRFDPSREAVVLATPFTRADEIGGRCVIGRRDPHWEALEDKVVCDEVFDAAGVEREPSEVVPAEPGALGAASRRIDQGAGVVWGGDAKEGFNGGAEYVRMIRRPDDRPEAEAFFAAHCDRVRVMPFLEGIPCSIHGFVHAGEVVAFRPVELIVLRRPTGRSTNTFLYAGTASFWDPPDADREAIREVARLVGAELARRVDYRGGFTVDGVLTVDGFRPTELNARFGAGTVPLTASLMLPIGTLNALAVEDPAADLRPADLERLVVSHADANRAGSAYTVLPHKQVDEAAPGLGVVLEDPRPRRARDGEDIDGTLVLGPSGVGGFVSFTPAVERTPVGASFAPTAVRAFAFADEVLGTGLGPLEAATEVR